MTISLDSYLSGGGAVSSFTPTDGYVHGVTTSGDVTIDITAPKGKKIVFTHFRPMYDGTLNIGAYDEPYHLIVSLTIDSVNVIGAVSNANDLMGRMQYGSASNSNSDASYSHPFVGFKMSTFNASFRISSSRAAIAYTYYITDE